jgi:hypothetical protein
MLLEKGCFGHEFQGKKIPGFEFLTCGQIRSHETFGHNSGWYNKLGEKLGWGDLNKNDIQKIIKALPADELFITLGEQDSFWNFVTEIGMIGSQCKTRTSAEAPGIHYVAEHCRYLIKKDGIYTKEFYSKKAGDVYEQEGLKIHIISEKEILEQMVSKV